MNLMSNRIISAAHGGFKFRGQNIELAALYI